MWPPQGGARRGIECLSNARGELEMARVFKRRKIWYIDYAYQGQRIREAVGDSKAHAKEALKARLGEIAQGRFNLNNAFKRVRFSRLIDEYLSYSKANKRSYKRDIISTMNLSKFFQNRQISIITSWHVEQYKNERKSFVAAATVNRELACLKHMFNLAIQWGWTNKNPVRQVKLFKENNTAMRILANEEARLLLNAANPRLKHVVTIALNTGMRKGEILSLKWEDIDLQIKAIRVTNTKNGEVRAVPINSEVEKVLLEIRKLNKGQYLFPWKYDKPQKEIAKAFRGAIARAGISPCTFHSLRHTFASNLVMMGVDLVTVKELLGHKSISMTMRYSHPSPEHKRRAIQQLVTASNVAQIWHKGGKSRSRKKAKTL